MFEVKIYRFAGSTNSWDTISDEECWTFETKREAMECQKYLQLWNPKERYTIIESED